MPKIEDIASRKIDAVRAVIREFEARPGPETFTTHEVMEHPKVREARVSLSEAREILSEFCSPG